MVRPVIGLVPGIRRDHRNLATRLQLRDPGNGSLRYDRRGPQRFPRRNADACRPLGLARCRRRKTTPADQPMPSPTTPGPEPPPHDHPRPTTHCPGRQLTALECNPRRDWCRSPPPRPFCRLLNVGDNPRVFWSGRQRGSSPMGAVAARYQWVSDPAGNEGNKRQYVRWQWFEGRARTPPESAPL